MSVWDDTVAWCRRVLSSVLRPRRETDLDAEFRAHLAMHAKENRRAGMSPAEARRKARAQLGGGKQIKERVRDNHPLHRLGTVWLDVKLGLRMLRKYWGLTVVGGLAMTLAIGIGAVGFAVFDTFFRGTVPLDEGDRVVALQTWDDVGSRRTDTAWRDIERWRDTLRSVEDLGAHQTRRRALVTDDGVSTVVDVAEMTASGFRLARVAPALGLKPASRPRSSSPDRWNLSSSSISAFADRQRPSMRRRAHRNLSMAHISWLVGAPDASLPTTGPTSSARSPVVVGRPGSAGSTWPACLCQRAPSPPPPNLALRVGGAPDTMTRFRPGARRPTPLGYG